MASFSIHLAVGKRYFEKSNTIKNCKEFYKGVIAPDLVDDKSTTHYCRVQDENNLLVFLPERVRLDKYLKNNSIETDYQKGVFLHLITDHLFYNNFFDSEYLKNIHGEEFWKDLYYSYDITDQYLGDKYQIDYTDFLNQVKDSIKKSKKANNITDEKRNNILPLTKLDNFIEYVSDISLENYKDKIIKSNGNVLP